MTEESAALNGGIEALRRGDRREARRILGEIVRDEPENAAAWWYLSAALNDTEQQVQCLKNVLRIKPDHRRAQDLLNQLERRVAHRTPTDGFPRPVIDFEELQAGFLTPIEPPSRSSLPLDEGQTRKPGAFWFVAGGILILTFVIILISVLAGTAELLEETAPTITPTAIVVEFDVPTCEVSNTTDSTIIFENLSGITLDLYTGPQGREELLIVLGPEATFEQTIRADIRTRFFLDTQADGYAGSGAVIDVAPGNICYVQIR